MVVTHCGQLYEVDFELTIHRPKEMEARHMDWICLPNLKIWNLKGFLNLKFSEYHHDTLENSTPHLNVIGCGQNEHTLKYYVK